MSVTPFDDYFNIDDELYYKSQTLHEENKASSKIPKRMQWLRTFSYLMDEAFRIPYTSIRIGLDPLLGLFPVIGDFISFILSMIAFFVMRSFDEVNDKVAIEMLFNLFIDFIVGSIPIVGDVFDIYFKANKRNWKLFKRCFYLRAIQSANSNGKLLEGTPA
ncbi:hypothetical protein ABK040_005760 [Willaertia magna]